MLPPLECVSNNCLSVMLQLIYHREVFVDGWRFSDADLESTHEIYLVSCCSHICFDVALNVVFFKLG